MRPFLPLPDRTESPRNTGITHVLDTGLSVRQAEDLVAVAAPLIDVVKLGWGTALVTQGTVEKVAIYRAAGLGVTFGGTLLEAAVLAGRVDAFADACIEVGMTHVEVSDGTIELPRADKLALIERFAAQFVVMSEVGSKDAAAEIDPSAWAAWAEEERAAGAWKIVLEARESGTVGLYGSDGTARDGLIDVVTARVPVEEIVFEAPQKSQQAWLVERYGPNVNLGNIAPDQVVPLETLRLGLRGDTLLAMQRWIAEDAPV